MEFILKTHSLCKKYKNQFAVNDVNMSIAKGDVYGFIGENGAGKTTIIRLITGLANATSGDYELFGESINTSTIYNARRRVSAIVESPSLYLNMNAYDNLKVQCRVLGVVDLNYIDDVLEIVGLTYMRNDSKKVRDYSLGMRQRLGIAVALIGHPDFIVLDEPMNGLDPEGIVEIRELILKLNREKNITFLISSHILDELSKVVTKYGFIHHGKLIQEITTKELANQCRKCVELMVSNLNGLSQLLDNVLHLKNYKVMNQNTIRIYDEVDIAFIITTLANNGIVVQNVSNKDENIEEYYLNLMGGNKHA